MRLCFLRCIERYRIVRGYGLRLWSAKFAHLRVKEPNLKVCECRLRTLESIQVRWGKEDML